jgi:rhamnosyl/mannosyltransferase
MTVNLSGYTGFVGYNLLNYISSKNKNIKFVDLKNANDNELVEYYKNADLFVFPSINEAEAFGVVQLEALANGLPVINSNLKSGVPFVSLDDYSGITVESKNRDALRNAIEKVISNKELYELYSFNALERVKSFSREKMCEVYKKIYQSE